MAFTPKMPKLKGTYFLAMIQAVLRLQLSGVLQYGKLVKKLEELPKLPGDETRPYSAEIIRRLWQSAVDMKSAPGKWKVTLAHVNQRVKAIAKIWEAAHVCLPVPADAPDGTKPVVVKFVDVNGVKLYRTKDMEKPAQLPEGTMPAQYPDIFGLEIAEEPADPFADVTGLEELDIGDVDFGDIL